ncbi:aspartyl protease family protein [Echinicola jeungdonensis]|uniref:Aspartyl protease family protein n=1 Tax=Echinicola jeungdonensis TaxID=709343 RepID=A0ABV5J7B7_9BACT|nr:aspartyl protease family protein [Echinicola jeungdonensis]MDN3669125.1 aspartyl protease family protein [Echinicola jeungdonensis]
MKEEKRKVKIPFFDHNNLVVVPVSLNKGEPLNFLLDTGVKSNILFSKGIGDAMGLFYTRKLNLMGADGKTVLTALVSPNNHFDLGPVEGTFQAILVLTEDFFELDKVIGVPIHGILGYEFFKFNPVKIDYDNQLISFYRKDVFKCKPFGYREMNLDFDNYKPYIQSTIKQYNGPDLEAKLLIDTGANHGLLLNRETSEDIVLPPVTLETHLGRALGGNLFGHVGRIRKYSMGRLSFKRVITSFPEETDYSSIIIGSGRKGSLGSDVISRLQVIFDYPRERLFFKKGGKFGTPFVYDMSGMDVKMASLEDRKYYISEVRENSPAENLGIKPGDEIVKINQLPAEYWQLHEILELLKSEEGKEILLTLRRKEEQEWKIMEVSLTLKKQL